ncbi:hypothetical protein F5B22DRAFT_610721 [Xylaria bambusicola]|uniref:uncharacterized protein n=1 Tax=Xylaria bambusicola TaxID=326684 RepID=UPI002008C61A|nr:uncharacterized protein F5B22DRAFT_610721 [Xylaria bambusicola]KAI0514499.1 hypothetical protein F5B22DRAFT_610721 [Xylaria bambusicola]
MSSRSRDYHRSRSRADNIIDALESGRLLDAVKELNPSRSSNDHRHHQRRHHNTRAYDYYDEGPPRRSRYDDYYPPENDEYYYDSRSHSRRHRSAHSDRRHDDSRGRSSHKRSSSSHGSGLDFKQVAGAAVTAGVIEAWRSRHDADKTMRIATAAIGAAATDSALGGRRDGKDKRHIVESALAGLVENRVINGPTR